MRFIRALQVLRKEQESLHGLYRASLPYIEIQGLSGSDEENIRRRFSLLGLDGVAKLTRQREYDVQNTQEHWLIVIARPKTLVCSLYLVPVHVGIQRIHYLPIQRHQGVRDLPWWQHVIQVRLLLRIPIRYVHRQLYLIKDRVGWLAVSWRLNLVVDGLANLLDEAACTG